MSDTVSPERRRPSHEPLTRLRIARVIEQLKAEVGSYVKLEEAIKESIARAGGGASGAADSKEAAPRYVDRRKLKAIVDHDPKLVLTLGELRALDRFLEPHGEGLAYNPLFEKPQLMRHIAESGRVDFLLGSKFDPSDPFRINISHWDVLGLNGIQAELLGLAKTLNVRIQEIPMLRTVEDARGYLEVSEHRDLFGEGGPSLVSLGSSRGNQMAERMLCTMAGLHPFDENQPEANEIPFRFVWPRKKDYVLESCFHRYSDDVMKHQESVGRMVRDKGVSCVQIGNDYLIDELTHRDQRQGDTYALCVAQRRATGRTWLLVAGLTGPATYAAARWAHRMPIARDEWKPGRPSPVVWQLLRAKAMRVEQGERHTYHVGDAEPVTGGTAWRDPRPSSEANGSD